jgi:hypothetical protein
MAPLVVVAPRVLKGGAARQQVVGGLQDRVSHRTRDASLILAFQLIAAKLNLAQGSDAMPIAGTVADADQRLSAYPGKLPYKVAPSSAAGQGMVSDGSTLDSYNNAALTPTCTNPSGG